MLGKPLNDGRVDGGNDRHDLAVARAQVRELIAELERTRAHIEMITRDKITLARERDDANERAEWAEDVITAARKLDGWPRRPYSGDATDQVNAELQDLQDSRNELHTALKAYDDAAQPPRAGEVTE